MNKILKLFVIITTLFSLTACVITDDGYYHDRPRRRPYYDNDRYYPSRPHNRPPRPNYPQRPPSRPPARPPHKPAPPIPPGPPPRIP